MPLTNTNKMLKYAMKNKSAIGAFNFTNLEQLNAIIDASNKTQIPVILGVSESAINFCGLQTIVAMAKAKTQNLKIDVALHLDHGKSFDICKQCIDSGFTSVMFDGSALPFEQNIEQTKKVVDYAHKKNVSVEGELGILKGVEDDVSSNFNYFTSPIMAKEFVEKTKVDSLAISIGTSHGAYKFKGKTNLNYNILREIKSLLPSTPLVLHGASSINKKIITEFCKSGGKLENANGVDNASIKKCVELGICKINTDSDLRIVFTTAIKNILKNPEVFSPRDYLIPAQNALKDFVKEKILLFKN